MRGIRIGAVGLALVLSACGGGDASDQLGGGGLTVAPSSLTFTYVLGGPTPPSQTILGSWTAPDVYAFGAALPAGVPLPAWLLNSTGRSSSPTGGLLPISVRPAGLAVGTYTVTLLVGTVNRAGDVIGYREVPVTLVVKAKGG